MKRIAIDMDGVLADYFEQFIKWDFAETGVRKTREDSAGKADEEVFEKARTYLHQPGFFREMPVIADSQRIVQELNKKFELFIVSAATEFPGSLLEKQAWLNEHFPFITWQQMVFCGHKSIIQSDIMIDDHFKNLNSFNGKTILFTQPHNEKADAGRHIRVYHWKEIEQLLLNEELSKTPETPVDFSPAISKYA